MNNLTVFNYESSEVRIVTFNNEPWWVAKDVCDVLELSNPTMAIKVLDDDEVTKFNLGGLSGETNIINRSGLYSLILSSRKPEAKRFKRWITHEVLPSIEKNGGYIRNQENLTPEQIVANALVVAQNIITNQANQIESLKPKAYFAESVMASQTNILIGELAKILKQNGHDIGQNRLFDWLRKKGYLINRRGTDYNMPTQRSMELGLFKIKESTLTHSDGHTTINKTTKVTGKGQVYFVNKFKEMGATNDIKSHRATM